VRWSRCCCCCSASFSMARRSAGTGRSYRERGQSSWKVKHRRASKCGFTLLFSCCRRASSDVCSRASLLVRVCLLPSAVAPEVGLVGCGGLTRGSGFDRRPAAPADLNRVVVGRRRVHRLSVSLRRALLVALSLPPREDHSATRLLVARPFGEARQNTLLLLAPGGRLHD
jgi:hypothetical protein